MQEVQVAEMQVSGMQVGQVDMLVVVVQVRKTQGMEDETQAMKTCRPEAQSGEGAAMMRCAVQSEGMQFQEMRFAP